MDETEVGEDDLVAANLQQLDTSEAGPEANSITHGESSVDEGIVDCASVISCMNERSLEGNNESSRGLILHSEGSDHREREVAYLDDDCIVDEPQVSRTTKEFFEDEIVDISPSGFPLSVLRKIPQKNQAAAFHVKQMYVFDNTFTVLPPSISHFKGLQSLKLFSNEVRLLPKEVGYLTNLQQLHVKICPPSLENFLPLSKISGLKTLELHQTPQRPSALTLPVELLELQALTRLSICHFSISSLPPEIGTLKNLEALDLSFNKLKALPKEVIGLRHLKSLRVASNRLSELPFELSYHSNLESIDVAYNRITSLMSLNLVSMTSLRTLNVQFNRLEAIGEIPKHLKCSLQGNEQLHLGSPETKQCRCGKKVQYNEMRPLSPQKEISLQGDLSSSISSSTRIPLVKGNTYVKSRPACKRQDNQQQKARQDRLNSSRNTKSDDAVMSILVGEEATLVKKAANLVAIDMNIEGSHQDVLASCNCHTNLEREGGKLVPHTNCPHFKELEREESRMTSHRDTENDEIQKKCEELQESDCKDNDRAGSKNKQLVCVKQTGHVGVASKDSSSSFVIKEPCREVATQIEHSYYDHELLLSGKSEDQWKDGKVDKNHSQEQIECTYIKLARNRSGKIDVNPKPSKRRKSLDTFSDVSYKYCKESFCGFQDKLSDGFYDAGRDRPFLPLDVLEEEQLSFNYREVILVDRERDEDLDAIAMSAKQLLEACSEKRSVNDVLEEQRGVKFQNVSLLALYVSDCFGGSDKTFNVTRMRRATLGGTAGSPFVCSCSMDDNASVADNQSEASASLAGVLPSLQMLCDGAVRYLKLKRGSNVLPIGSLPYGVCRHRAILLKYLCDRSDPIIPCELIRGYLDYTPHAWNVALVLSEGTTVRMLVDACRPLDIRSENDPEYFCRYIPFKRIRLPKLTSECVLSSTSSCQILSPRFLEEIGRGASGAVVRRCTFGSLVAAAKVRQLADVEVSGGLEKCFERRRWLSELQMLSSVGEHPCIVKFYGHELSLSRLSSDKEQVPLLKIYMEYIAGGSLEALFKVLAKEGQRHMPMPLALHVARSIASALVWLHSRGIMHRDVKSSNVLVDFEPESSASSSVMCVSEHLDG
ncbi:hypothetical protein O6H91_03G036000 [Diphasiastrum complanatum]|uniref:Uncharacterized protein n=1 Tax=Diphasiastrum complanatum TaxID=34168 RepID=A0ACC2E5C8_DIPCM|nr:hypothetical protein O6H91_03G036000 [Diphasiastrum complanatum]